MADTGSPTATEATPGPTTPAHGRAGRNLPAAIGVGVSLAAALVVTLLWWNLGFVLLVAFGKQTLATPIGDGVMTWGIPIGFGVILFTIVVTAIYVLRANREYDDLTDRIKREALK